MTQRSMRYACLFTIFAFSSLPPTIGLAAEAFNSAALGLYQEPGFALSRSFGLSESVDRVDPFTGALKIVHKDLVIPGNGGLDIEVLRNYQGVSNTAGPYSNGYTSRTPFGTGWDIHFGRLWVSETYQTLAAGANNKVCQIGQVATNLNPILELPDGTRETLANGNGSSQAFITKSRWIATCLPASQNKGDGGLVLHSPEGLKYTFNLKGTVSPSFQFRTYFVTRIEDLSGNRLDLEYNIKSSNLYAPHHLLTRVKASDGRTVSFNYKNESSTAAIISSISGEGQTVSYTFSDAAYSVGAKAQYLTRASNPDGTDWRYTYNDSNSLAGTSPGRFSIATMKSPLGLSTSYTYDYKQMGSDPSEKTNIVTGRRVSSIRGSSHSAYTWAYTYTKGVNKNDVTVEKGPEQCVRYEHVGANTIANGVSAVDRGLWTIGLLVKKETSKSCGSALRTETYTWGSQNISEQNEMRRYNLLVENYTRAPILTKKVVSQSGTYTTDYTYDANGQPTKLVESGDKSRTITNTYTLPGGNWMLGKLASQTTSGITGSLKYSYTSSGKVSQEDRYGVVTKYTYLAAGDLNTLADANGKVARYEDYYRGVPRKETYADGGVLTRTVNETGTVASVKDVMGQTTSYTYDKANRLTGVTPPKGAAAKITIGYSFGSNNVETLTRGAYKRVREYNELGQLLKQTESGSASVQPVVVTATYSPSGGRTFLSNPNFASAAAVGEKFEYDALNRLTRITHADGSTISMNHGAKIVTTTDERGNATVREYVSFGEPDERLLVKVTEPGSNVTSITIDNLGRTTAIAQGGLSRTYTYDAKGFVASETNPETGVTAYTHDGVGNVLTKKVGAAVADQYVYDARNRLKKVTYVDGTALEYGYDLAGRVLFEVFAGTDRRYTYDSHGNLLSERLNLTSLGKNYVAAYAYDALDALTSITYPSGLLVDLAPNTYGQTTKAGSFASVVSYHANGSLKGLTYGNGRSLSIGLDANRLRPTQRSVGGSDTLLSLQYGYDAANNITKVTDLRAAAYTQTLGYDALNRLVSAAGSWGTGSFAYNARGDLTSRTLGGLSTTYAYDAQGRLASLSGSLAAALSYDAKGNVLQARGSYAYDGAGNLDRLCVQPKANCASAPDQRFGYDGKGMRVLQEQGGVRKVSFYGQAGLLLEEDLATNKRKEYIYAGGELIAHGGSDGTLYYHNDHLGSPVAASNAQGALQWRTHFRPYGERQAEGGANVGSIGYTGHMQDDGSGLVYAGARYYDPVVGRFLAIDPVGVDAGRPVSFNRYAYANNSPYGFVDPDGRSPVVAMEIAVAGAQILTGTAIVNSTGGMTAFPAHQGGGEVYGGSSIDPTISGAWHTGRPASGFDLLTWMLTVKSSAGNTLQPGPHAGESVPARGPSRDFTKGERDKINEIGRKTGCHTCGSTDPRTTSGNHIPDHQPANALNPSGGPQELYPHCLTCSRVQGGQVRGAQGRSEGGLN
ncbi:RHS repeat domain-containing protein [Phytopseudomonas daroniae]|uniref:RHS repeat domain-containing protein n=1 Tax=Phytopseudomonas daroniae TaxID=2487519 RepID=UPI0010384B02|nr:RHS repeat-associated core domain-containing protein [Pseudomonas daroniae]TBU74091.1 RHS repeat protein [Pseudomonas daroniae]